MSSLESKSPMASLYIENLHPKVTENELLEKFSSAGPITSIQINIDNGNKGSFGNARIDFKEPADAKRALETMNMELIRNRPIRVMWYQPDVSLRRSCVGKIFVKNLNTNINDMELYDTFVSYGKILSCKVTKDSRGNSKGYGYVHFETENAAKVAIEEVYGKKLRDKRVFVQKFIPLEEHKEAMRKKEELVKSLAASVRAIMEKSNAAKAAGEQSQTIEKAESVTEKPQVDDNTIADTGNSQSSETQAPILETECKANIGSPNAPQSPAQSSETKHLTSVLVNCTAQLKAQILFEIIYPRIERMCPPLAAKVFDTLLKNDSSELLLMIEDEEVFKTKIIETILVMETDGKEGSAWK